MSKTLQGKSRQADKFVVRMPAGMRTRVEQRAIDDDRSMNAVIIQALRAYLGEEKKGRAAAAKEKTNDPL